MISAGKGFQEFQEFAEGASAVAQPILLLAGQLGKGFSQRLVEKDGIVAESSRTAS